MGASRKTAALPALTLRKALVWPLAGLTLVLSLGIGWMSYSAGGQAVENVTERLLLDASTRIGMAIELNLGAAASVLEAAMPAQAHPPADIGTALTTLRDRFWTATSPGLVQQRYVYYGNEAGQFLGVQRNGTSNAEMGLKLTASAFRKIYTFDGLPGPLSDGRTETGT